MNEHIETAKEILQDDGCDNSCRCCEFWRMKKRKALAELEAAESSDDLEYLQEDNKRLAQEAYLLPFYKGRMEREIERQIRLTAKVAELEAAESKPNDTTGKFCGDCFNWMKTSLCPKEKGFENSILNPSIGSVPCDKFRLKPELMELTQDLINTWNEYLSTSNAILNIPRKRESCKKVNALIGEACDRLEGFRKREAAANKEIERLSRWHDYFAWEREMEKKEKEIERLRQIIRGALAIKALWEPADNMENIDEGKALLQMAKQFEQALKGQDDGK